MLPQKTFFFFGRSGSGKGTQAALLIKWLRNQDKKRSVLYIETGARVRDFMHLPNASSRLTKEIIDQGGLLPEFLPVWIWSDYLINNFSGEEHLVLDGLCRRLPEASILDSALKFYKLKQPHIFLIDVSKDWARERLLGRGRKDDNKRDIDARLDWFDTNVVHSIDFFKGSSYYKFSTIDGEKSVEKVHEDILAAITKSQASNPK